MLVVNKPSLLSKKVRGENWSDEETDALLRLLLDEKVRTLMAHAGNRNRHVYDRLADCLHQVGVLRTGYQVKRRISNLKAYYKRMLDAGRKEEGFKFQKELELIYGLIGKFPKTPDNSLESPGGSSTSGTTPTGCEPGVSFPSHLTSWMQPLTLDLPTQPSSSLFLPDSGTSSVGPVKRELSVNGSGSLKIVDDSDVSLSPEAEEGEEECLPMQQHNNASDTEKDGVLPILRTASLPITENGAPVASTSSGMFMSSSAKHQQDDAKNSVPSCSVPSSTSSMPFSFRGATAMPTPVLGGGIFPQPTLLRPPTPPAASSTPRPEAAAAAAHVQAVLAAALGQSTPTSVGHLPPPTHHSSSHASLVAGQEAMHRLLELSCFDRFITMYNQVEQRRAEIDREVLLQRVKMEQAARQEEQRLKRTDQQQRQELSRRVAQLGEDLAELRGAVKRIRKRNRVRYVPYMGGAAGPCDKCEEKKKVASMSKAQIGKPAPDFKTTALIGSSFKDVKLADYKGKYLVLFFYPLDFTFVCPTEIIAFSDAAEEFRKVGCEILACSTDSEFSHLAWTEKPRNKGGIGPMDIPLLADTSHQISRDYGVLKEDAGIAYRGLFIIDDKGVLRQITVNDLPVGRDVGETLRLVNAFQFTDKHGEVCPAGWRPGKPTMKPNPKESQEYFSKS